MYVLLLAEGAKKGGLTDPDFGLVVWTLVLFGLFAALMAKVAWGPLLAVIEDREQSVRASVEGAEKAKSEGEALLAQHREMLREAGREREEIIKRALAEAETLKADLSTRARTESEQMIARARAQIEREKLQALSEIHAQVADIAMAAAAKIVQSSLTPDAQRKLVDEFITDLPRVQ